MTDAARREYALRCAVCEANRALPQHGLVTLTWGNVSGIDRARGIVVIKPSGVAYDALTPENMVAVPLDGGAPDSAYNPSSDTPTHLFLYKCFPHIGGVVHTHSTWATAFAQAGRSLAAYGTTHADHFYGTVPCTRTLTTEAIRGAYETETGRVIVETFEKYQIDPQAVPGALVMSHGPFTWGGSPEAAVQNAVVLEETAKMAALALFLNPGMTPVEQPLLDKHFLRKHGADAYYGQKKTPEPV